MNWQDYIMGGMTVIIAYAFFASGQEPEEALVTEETEASLVVNDITGRYVTLSCQTCRKLKRHKEIRPNVFQCSKCKRHVDISA